MSFDTWFFYYQNYILDLRSIFVKNFSVRFPDFREDLYSDQFLNAFAKKIYDRSSKKIPIDLVENMTENLEDD